MGLLERYILREYIKILLLTLGMLMITYLAIDVFEKIRRFADYDPSLKAVLVFFSLRLPRVIFEMMPLALLFTTVLTMSYFSKTNEITAIKTGGVNLMRVTAPLLGFALIIGFALLMANWSLIPMSNRQAGLVKKIQIEKKDPSTYFSQEQVWMRLDRRSFFNVQLIGPSREDMYGVSLYRLTPDFEFREILEAKRMRFQEGGWVMFDGVKRTFGPDQTLDSTRFEQHPVVLNRTPKDFQGAVPRENELTYAELSRYRERLIREGISASRYEVEMAVRTALPFTGLIMVLVGIPFGLQDRARSGGLAKGIGLCLAIALAYWFVLSLALSLGKSGILPPPLAAWLANLTFLAIGLYLFIQMRQ